MDTVTAQDQQRDALVERLMQASAGMFDIYTTYLGATLGLYDALAQAGPETAGALAARTGTHPRYVREWLEQQTVIGTLAGLREVKNLPMLVRAVAGVPVSTRLVIVGDGPDRERIEAAAAAMDMTDRLHLPGFLPDPYRYIGLFDIFALSSRSEQFPISVVEAMAAGLPVSSPHVGDVCRMLSMANYPYIAPNVDEVELRDSLTFFARDPERRKSVGKANQDRARAEYDEAAMIARYAALYGEAIGKPGVFG